MATVKAFEELDVWKMAREFAKKVHALLSKGSFAKDFALRKQISESSGSIMDNIAEGFERGGNREFILFLSYSKGSTGEARSQLYRALDRDHISLKVFEELSSESTIISKKIGALMSYLKQSELKGSKFHEPDSPYTGLEY